MKKCASFLFFYIEYYDSVEKRRGEKAMRKIKQFIGFICLLVCSVIYDYQQPEIIQQQEKEYSYVILEGAFLREGKYEFEGKMTVQDIIEEVGVKEQANLEAISLESYVEDESRLYLPVFKENTISLNHATLEEFMTLKGVGEKTAQKIVDYRQQQPFEYIEDIMNISGIGEKTYLRLREDLCL